MQACPEGHYQRQWYNSCRNRVCPQCNWLQIEQWLQRENERLLKCGHYHMIFTIPHELNEIWRFNMKEMTNILFRAVRDTLFAFFLDEKHIGGKPGIIATLHTWSQTLIEHLHIHCLVTEGGISNDRQWKKRNNGYLLPVRAVMLVFRGKMLAYVHQAIEKAELTIPEIMSMQRWKNLRNKLGRKKWNVNIRERYEYGTGVLKYLDRYIQGGAISNKRIVSNRNGEVKFRFRTGGGTSRDAMRLPVEVFMKRCFNHVPEPFTKVVRYYGLYASRAKEELAECRQLGQEPVSTIEEYHWQSYCDKRGNEHPEQCPVCGRRLVRLADIPRPYYSGPPGGKRLRKAA